MLPRPSSDKILLFGSRLLLAAIFLYAAVDKVIHPAAFAEAVSNYQILPERLVNLTAIILPWIEFVVGFCLLSGVFLPGAACLATTLLLVFWGGLLFNLARGLDVDCGCFGASSGGSHAMTWYVIRDAVFLGLSLLLCWQVFRRRRNATLVE